MMLTCFLVFLMMVPYSYGTNAATEAVTCIEKWLNSKAEGTTDQIHCTRLKVCVDCLSEQASGSSKVLDDFRYIVEQEAVLAMKYGICNPPVNFENLKRLVTESGAKTKYQHYSIDNDKVQSCAFEVHKKCIKHWIAVFKDEKMCKDFSQFVECLHVEDKKSGCNAATIRHLISMLDVVGNDFLQQVRDHMGYECHDNELD